jgi:hypothetical protein
VAHVRPSAVSSSSTLARERPMVDTPLMTCSCSPVTTPCVLCVVRHTQQGLVAARKARKAPCTHLCISLGARLHLFHRPQPCLRR